MRKEFEEKDLIFESIYASEEEGVYEVYFGLAGDGNEYFDDEFGEDDDIWRRLLIEYDLADDSWTPKEWFSTDWCTDAFKIELSKNEIDVINHIIDNLIQIKIIEIDKKFIKDREEFKKEVSTWSDKYILDYICGAWWDLNKLNDRASVLCAKEEILKRMKKGEV